MSIGQVAVMLCSWEVKVGMMHSTCGLDVWVVGKTV